MKDNEQSGPEARTIAGRVLRRGFAWPSEATTLAASVLTQAPTHAGSRPPPSTDRHGVLKKGL